MVWIWNVREREEVRMLWHEQVEEWIPISWEMDECRKNRLVTNRSGFPSWNH